MATSSILGGTPVPEEISGKDVQSLGPSDNSDSGSDAVGAYGSEELASDTDAAGTGESASIGDGQPDADILPDHIERAPGAQDDSDIGPDDTGSPSSDEFTDAGDLGEVGELADDSQEAEAGEEDDEEPGQA
jgi:hypothetical protein